MMIFSVYDLTTGGFVGRKYIASSRQIAALNLRPGEDLMEGDFDHLSSRVEDGRVVNWQPPRPDEDSEWDPITRRWQLSAVAGQRSVRATAAKERIAVLEQRQARAIREAVLDPTNTAARDILVAIDNEIAALRGDL